MKRILKLFLKTTAILYIIVTSHFFFMPYEVFRFCDCIDGKKIQFKMIDYKSKRDSFKNLRKNSIPYKPKGKVYWGSCKSLKNATIQELKNRHSKILSVDVSI